MLHKSQHYAWFVWLFWFAKFLQKPAVSKLAPIAAASFLCSRAEQKDIAESGTDKLAKNDLKITKIPALCFWIFPECILPVFPRFCR